MAKIHETLITIQAGARNNKYQVMYPYFGEDFDVVCNATSLPGRELGTVEVFVKGRKYQLAGEMADDGAWEVTFYNTPDLFHRNFFLQMLEGVHSFYTPSYLVNGGDLDASTLGGINNINTNQLYRGGTTSAMVNDSSFLGNLANTLGKVNKAVDDVKKAYNDTKNVWDTATQTFNDLKGFLNGNWNELETVVKSTGYLSKPWYQHEVKVYQMDHNDQPITGVILHDLFPTSVSGIEYTDETGEISTTTVTFAYSHSTYI